jgi:hypothetical protein
MKADTQDKDPIMEKDLPAAGDIMSSRDYSKPVGSRQL